MASDPPSTKELLLDEFTKTVGEDALQTVPLITVGAPPVNPSPLRAKLRCSTQIPTPRVLRNGAANLMVGMKADCPRWIPGSVVKWAAWQNGFNSKADADHAATQLAMATEAWNRHSVGVTFEQVTDAKDATFVLCHGGDRGESNMAQSFFPNDNDLNFLLVYTGAFRGDWKKNMWKIFTHELGHIMGLRHEYAMEPADDGSGGTREEYAEVIGVKDPESVMSDNSPPEIQDSDVKSIKVFYGLKTSANNKPPQVGRTLIKDCAPQ